MLTEARAVTSPPAASDRTRSLADCHVDSGPVEAEEEEAVQLHRGRFWSVSSWTRPPLPAQNSAQHRDGAFRIRPQRDLLPSSCGRPPRAPPRSASRQGAARDAAGLLTRLVLPFSRFYPFSAFFWLKCETQSSNHPFTPLEVTGGGAYGQFRGTDHLENV